MIESDLADVSEPTNWQRRISDYKPSDAEWCVTTTGKARNRHLCGECAQWQEYQVPLDYAPLTLYDFRHWMGWNNCWNFNEVEFGQRQRQRKMGDQELAKACHEHSWWSMKTQEIGCKKTAFEIHVMFR